ncbi:MAG TPA: hypothetical protein EYH17_01915 [Pyrodictium sp.]|nr:hypothetical protein [Pyrodictium sp.]
MVNSNYYLRKLREGRLANINRQSQQGNTTIEVEVIGSLSAKLRTTKLVFSVKGRITVEELLALLANKLTSIFHNARPKPGILIFINGRDYRVYSKDELLGDRLKVVIIQVFHGG